MIKIINYKDKFKKQVISLILGILDREFKDGRKAVDEDLNDIKRIYQNGGGNFWIALDNNKVVGTIALINCKKRKGCLKRMYVKEKYRGTGTSAKLLGMLLNFAKKNNYKEIYLSTTRKMIAANKFYKKSGFENIKLLPKYVPNFGDSVFYRMKLL